MALAPGGAGRRHVRPLGQGTVRAIDRPKRLTTLDFLYYVGNRRFGALVVWLDLEVHRPCPESPFLIIASLDGARMLIQRIIDNGGHGLFRGSPLVRRSAGHSPAPDAPIGWS